MPIEGPGNTPRGELPPETAWGFSGHVVALVRTRDQAAATIRFFGYIRKFIVASPLRGQATATAPAPVSPEDSKRWSMGGFSGDEKTDVIVRALRVIAFDPAGRADTLLSLDVHIAYLCGSFGLAEQA
jgi:hypothetical protein